MEIFSEKGARRLVEIIFGILAVGTLLLQLLIRGTASLPVFLVSLLSAVGILLCVYRYLSKQAEIEKEAEILVNSFLDGNTDARIACDEEGQIFRLFQAVNSMAAVLNARAVSEQKEKAALKNTISDISHQLKTPLSALNIYNGLIQNEAEELPVIKELCGSSERELDRIETLVQNLLKMAKLDAGMIVFEKSPENIGDMMRDIELRFACRAKQEQKALILSGDENLSLFCDREWILEAIGNIVKNALDHTDRGDAVHIEWRQFASIVQIKVTDNGSGIHPEDLYHIFKRFYRSRYSKDRQGVGLGLPLSKAIIEAHDGTIEVESKLGKGTSFAINFLIPTKL